MGGMTIPKSTSRRWNPWCFFGFKSTFFGTDVGTRIVGRRQREIRMIEKRERRGVALSSRGLPSGCCVVTMAVAVPREMRMCVLSSHERVDKALEANGRMRDKMGRR